MKQPLFSTSYAPRDGESILDEIERDGMKKSESSQLFNLSRNTINLWCQRQAATGDFQAKKYRPPGNGHKITDWDKFRKFVSLNGDKTQAEMAEIWKWRDQRSHYFQSSAENWVHAKKKTYGYRGCFAVPRRGNRDEERRQRFVEQLKHKAPSSVVFVDGAGMDDRDEYAYG